MLVLENLGFIKKLDIPFTEYKTSTASIAMDAVALDALQQVISSEDELLALKTTLECLRKIADEKGNPMFPVFEGQCKKKIFIASKFTNVTLARVVTLLSHWVHSICTQSKKLKGISSSSIIKNTKRRYLRPHSSVSLTEDTMHKYVKK